LQQCNTPARNSGAASVGYEQVARNKERKLLIFLYLLSALFDQDFQFHGALWWFSTTMDLDEGVLLRG